MAFNNKLKGERQSAEEIFRQKMAENKASTTEKEENVEEEKVPVKKAENPPKKTSKLWGCLWAIAIIIAVIRFIIWVLQ